MMHHSKVNSYAALATCFIALCVASSSLLSEMIPPPASLVSRSSECKDYSNFCPKGRKYGYCGSLIPYVKNFMQKYCKKSCELCQVPEPCVDKSPYCAYGKSVGQCSSANQMISDYMKKHCKKSCDLCKGNECSDSVPQQTCTKYKREGKCDAIDLRTQIERTCKKTCGLCDLSKSYPCGVSKLKKLASNGEDVVGGKTAKKGFWPWQVAIWFKKGFKCGGTLVNRRFVVTAAHCIYSNNVDDYSLVLGDHNRLVNEKTEQFVGVKKITVHPGYEAKVRNDIAIIELDQNAILTTYITPACLPTGSYGASPGTKCFITGWGRMYITELATNNLQVGSLVIEKESRCKRRKDYDRKFYQDTMLCARNPKNVFTSGCHGDSGGPLVCEDNNGRMVLQGVVSWGSSTCDSLDRATVFTKVASFLPWIKKIVES